MQLPAPPVVPVKTPSFCVQGFSQNEADIIFAWERAIITQVSSWILLLLVMSLGIRATCLNRRRCESTFGFLAVTHATCFCREKLNSAESQLSRSQLSRNLNSAGPKSAESRLSKVSTQQVSSQQCSVEAPSSLHCPSRKWPQPPYL